MILGVCERFGCLPSDLYREDVEILRLLAIEAAGRPPDQGQGDMGGR